MPEDMHSSMVYRKKQVMPYCVMEKHRVLWNDRNTLSETVQTDRINGMTTQVDAARVRLEKP